jgi:hypothetical protein
MLGDKKISGGSAKCAPPLCLFLSRIMRYQQFLWPAAQPFRLKRTVHPSLARVNH